MHWVTREKARVDRIGRRWLIRRFIDRDLTFRFMVTAVTAREGVTPSDLPGVERGHHGDHGSFDAALSGA